jgi:lipopolysaccharide transport system ATP-binding protein
LRSLLGRSSTNYYRDFWALRQVSFEVRKGETLGIIGRNGSGKSTLLQIICGTLSPTEGSVEISGRVAALLELGAGFNPEFTGRENVYLNAMLLGLTRDQVDRRYDAIARFADIGAFINQPVKTYSSGMYVRLAFAIIAHVDADVLIIDEALAVGDAFFSQKCMRFLRGFMQTGTVLFVSHDSAAVQSLCDRAVLLANGAILSIGSAKEVVERYLEDLYEAQQGASDVVSNAPPAKEPSVAREPRDMRLDYLNCTQYRNDIEIFAFDPTAAAFGKGGARVVSVALKDLTGRPLSWVVGGEDVELEVRFAAQSSISAPIVGFLVKDRLGQALFGDNTYLTYRTRPQRVRPSQQVVAVFGFRMPLLPAGDYSVTVAVAEGTQQDHTQHHWIHDALLFKSHNSGVAQGLIGIPITKIELVVE